MTAIRGLTLTQPWAQLVADGRKRWETRSWGVNPLKAVGSMATPDMAFPLAIHAAKTWTPGDRSLAVEVGYRQSELPVGAIVAVVTVDRIVATEDVIPENWVPAGWTGPAVEVVSVEEYSFGDYSEGRWAWHLRDVVKLEHPILARGSLGLWSVTGPVARLLRDQVGER